MRRAWFGAVVGLVALSMSGCTLYGWGGNFYGQLGDGTLRSRSEPVAAARNPGWVQVDAGDSHSCGVDLSGALYCWGTGEVGQLGDGRAHFAQTIPTRVGTANDWIRVSAGGFGGSLPNADVRTGHTCGIRRPGALYCWGSGPIGTGAPFAGTPVQVGSFTDWTQVSAGGLHTCAIRAGALYCWGSNSRGQLGDGTIVGHPTPVQVGTASDWSVVSASFTAHTCGIRAGALYCWGDNTTGQIGDGTTIERTVPTRVGIAADWKQISTGGFGVWYGTDSEFNSFPGHSCGIRAGGALFCWGENGIGQLGDGTMTERHVPTREATNASWSTVSAGARLTCAIQPQGDLYCWGRGDLLGNGTNISSPVPTQALFGKWFSVSAGAFHMIGLRAGSDTL